MKVNVFKNRNYLLLFQGSLTSHIAASLYTFAISFYILAITNNNALIQGVYLGVCGLVSVLSYFIGGVIADRFSRIKLIYGIDFFKGFLICLIVIPIYFCLQENNYLVVLIILFVQGIINSFLSGIFSPASAAILTEICEKDELQQANSYLQSLSSLVNILGVVLAGVLYANVHILVLFLIIGVCLILSGVSEIFIKTSYVITDKIKLTIKQMKIDFVDGFKYLLTIKSICYFILGVLFINFFLTPIMSNGYPYLIKTDIANSNYLFKEFLAPEMISSIFSIMFSVGSIIAGIWIGSTRPKNKVSGQIKFFLTFMALILVCISVAYLTLCKKYINIFLIVLCICNILIGVCVMGVNVPISYTIQTKIEQTKLSKVNSLMNIGSQGLTPFASLLGGVLITYFGLGFLISFCAVGFLFTALFIDFNKTVNEL